jgi:Cu-processing system permease protein
MELSITWTIALRELREALRNKWLIGFAIGFSILSLALSRTSLASAGYAGLGGFGRTAASMVNALLLFVPLLGLSVGAGVIAGDRERGSLFYLQAQPVSKTEIFLGKALGTALGAGASLSIGFGIAMLTLSASGASNVTAFLTLAGYTLLLLLASLGLGFLVSTFTRRASTATGIALLLWLAAAFLGDLTLIGTVLALRPSPANLLALLVINPLQIFKLGAILSLHSTLDTLGAAGQYAVFHFGPALPLILVSLLLGWICAAFGAALVFFNRWNE